MVNKSHADSDTRTHTHTTHTTCSSGPFLFDYCLKVWVGVIFD